MRLNDAVTGLCLLVFAVAEMLYTLSFPSLHGQAYGPALFPVIIGSGLALCGLILIARGLAARRLGAGALENQPPAGKSLPKWLDPGPWAKHKRARDNGLILVLCLLGYILFSTTVGFILTSLSILLILLWRLGASRWQAIPVACMTTLVLQILFAKLLLVPLPAGWLQGLVW